MEKIIYVIPFIGIVGMLFALYLAMKINKQDPGTERMKEISAAIHGGAKAFLFAEYKILHDYFGRGANDVMKRLKEIKASV